MALVSMPCFVMQWDYDNKDGRLWQVQPRKNCSIKRCIFQYGNHARPPVHQFWCAQSLFHATQFCRQHKQVLQQLSDRSDKIVYRGLTPHSTHSQDISFIMEEAIRTSLTRFCRTAKLARVSSVKTTTSVLRAMSWIFQRFSVLRHENWERQWIHLPGVATEREASMRKMSRSSPTWWQLHYLLPCRVRTRTEQAQHIHICFSSSEATLSAEYSCAHLQAWLLSAHQSSDRLKPCNE